MSEREPSGIADDGSNVVFLLSSPRAGSTLLSAILNRHSRILCPAEPWFLLSLHALYHDIGTGIAAYNRGLADIGLREFAGGDEFLRAARAFASSLYGSRLVAAGRSVFVDKTPRYYHILPFLAALFPRARMIWLKRNPLDVAASYKTSWGVPVAEVVGRDLSPNSFDLTLGLMNLGAWFDGSPGRFEIVYEELVADPDEVVGRVLGSSGAGGRARPFRVRSRPGIAEHLPPEFSRRQEGSRAHPPSRPVGREVAESLFLPRAERAAPGARNGQLHPHGVRGSSGRRLLACRFPSERRAPCPAAPRQASALSAAVFGGRPLGGRVSELAEKGSGAHPIDG